MQTTQGVSLKRREEDDPAESSVSGLVMEHLYSAAPAADLDLVLPASRGAAHV